MTTALSNPPTTRRQDPPTFIHASMPSSHCVKMSHELTPEGDMFNYQSFKDAMELLDFIELALECGAVGFYREGPGLARAEVGKSSFCGECGR